MDIAFARSTRSLAFRLGVNQFVCVGIALMLWAFGIDRHFWGALIYSLLIGNLCWLFIDGGRLMVGRWRARVTGSSPEWPGWAWMAPVVLVGAPAGYLLGQTLARALLGSPQSAPAVRLPVLGISLVAATLVVYFYWAREAMLAERLAAEQARRDASEMQLKALQSQLEPHMLFNTLANLRVLIELDPPAAQTMLDQLIRFLRSTLAGTRVDRHRLAAEFELLADYLALMAVRMGARLVTDLQLPDELRDASVPPLLLQPLVENAVRHGLEPKVGGGRIEVRAAAHGGQLQLTVRDTGVGLGMSPQAGTSFGLDVVRQRLATAYGASATLVLKPATDAQGGAEALITLPLERAST